MVALEVQPAFEDDGVGFPENFDATRTDTLGMKIVRSLVAKLRGVSEWEDTGVGLRFACRFPAVDDVIAVVASAPRSVDAYPGY